MSAIHPTALVDKKSQIGKNVTVGPHAIIEPGAVIGDGTVIGSHVFIGRGTTIGRDNAIHIGAVIGHEAQYKESRGVASFLRVGDGNVFREYVTVHRGSTEGAATEIGGHNYFMASSHVGHDARVGDHVVMTNSSLLGGHVSLGDHCVLGGGSAVHQFCRIGAYAMVGGLASITKDLLPYMLVDDNDDAVGSINLVGLRRAGFSEEVKRDIKTAYKLFYLSGLTIPRAIEAIKAQCRSREVLGLLEFIKGTNRGILGHRRRRV